MKFKEGDGPASLSTPRPPTSCCSPPTTAASTRSPPTSCPAGAASASRCELMLDIDGEAQIRRLAARRRRRRSCCSPPPTGAGFVTAATERCSPKPARASRWSTCAPGAKLKVVRPIAPEPRLCRGGRRQPQAVVYPLEELPEMARGQGVQLQRYRDGGLSDATTLQASPRASAGRWAARAAAPAPRPTSTLAHRARRRRPHAAARLPPEILKAKFRNRRRPLRLVRGSF